MIDSIEILNYRCFKSLNINNLARVNFVVGDNGSGKTALLEALFMACGSTPQLYFHVRALRGVAGLSLSPHRGPYSSMFNNMFHNFDSDSVISIWFHDSAYGGDRSLSIAFEKQDEHSITLPLDGASYESTSVIPIVFKWKSPLGTHESRVDIGQDSIKVQASSDAYPGVLVSLLSTISSPTDNVARFSNLSKKKRLQQVTAAVRSAFPTVEDLSIEVDSGQNHCCPKQDRVVMSAVENEGLGA